MFLIQLWYIDTTGGAVGVAMGGGREQKGREEVANIYTQSRFRSMSIRRRKTRLNGINSADRDCVVAGLLALTRARELIPARNLY